MREKPAFSLPGGAMLLLVLVAIAGTLFVLMSSAQMQVTAGVVLAMFALGVEVICLKGLLIVNPNEGQVLQLFGTYVGTLRDQGWRWVNPFTTKRRISLRVDAEVVDWFKSKGPGYQTRINRILRKVMVEGKKRTG